MSEISQKSPVSAIESEIQGIQQNSVRYLSSLTDFTIDSDDIKREHQEFLSSVVIKQSIQRVICALSDLSLLYP